MSVRAEILARLARRLATLEDPGAARDGFESSSRLLAGLAPRAGSPLEWPDRRPLESLLRRLEVDKDLKAEYRLGWKRTEGSEPLSPAWREVLAVILLSQSALLDASRGWALKCLNSAFRILDRSASPWHALARELLEALLRETPA